MKHRLLPLLLALALSLSPALAAEGDAGFADVAPDDWFAPYVAVCANAGVMVGTGAGAFSPSDALTNAQCLTLALRLYDLQRGGNGALEQAPEDWGRLTLTLADGTVFSGGGYKGDGTFGWWWSRNGYEGAIVEVPGWSYDDMETGAAAQREWMDAHPTVCGADDPPATLTLNGVTYQGTTNCWLPVGPYVFQFQPEPDATAEVNAVLRDAVYGQVDPDAWYRDAYYTAAAWGLGDDAAHPGFSALLARDADLDASREVFAGALADAAGALEKRYDVADLPDLDREGNEGIYALYEAGVLNGVDDTGAFQGDKPLTRAQAAAMAARVLDESLRGSF